jgi:para-nitrobenzyl esterase
MSKAWLAFARSGDPNHGGIPRWPGYSSEHRSTMIFDNECKIANDPYGAERLAWPAN